MKKSCLTISQMPSGGLAVACRVTASGAATIMAKTGGCVPATSASESYLPRLRVADNCI